MLVADLALARRFVAAHPPQGRLLLLGVTGAHIYGFPSEDSDLDLKGIHLAPTKALLGLEPPGESVDYTVIFEGVECDLTTQEARKALTLLLGGNGNMLERILSPLQVVDAAAVEALQALARGCISKRFSRHYAGFFKGKRRDHLKAPKPVAKNLLYAYRVALTGVHLLRSGTLETDVTVLGPEYGFPEVAELVAWKRAHGEHCALEGAMDVRHQGNLDRLEGLLQLARSESTLPERPSSAAAISAWLVAQRLADLA